MAAIDRPHTEEFAGTVTVNDMTTGLFSWFLTAINDLEEKLSPYLNFHKVSGGWPELTFPLPRNSLPPLPLAHNTYITVRT